MNYQATLVVRARDEATKQIMAMQGKLGATFRNMGIALGGFLSMRAGLGFLKSSVNEFAEAEAASTRLRISLENIGAGKQVGNFEKFADTLERVTTYNNEAIKETLALGASMGMSGDTLKAATQAAMGFSKSMGVDVNTALTLVGKAANGDAASFSKYGVVLRSGMSDSEKFNAVLIEGARRFSLAESDSTKLGDSIKLMQNKWDDFKQNIGEAFAPAIVSAIDWIREAMNNMGLAWDVVISSSKVALDELMIKLVQVSEAFAFGRKSNEGIVKAAYEQMGWTYKPKDSAGVAYWKERAAEDRGGLNKNMDTLISGTARPAYDAMALANSPNIVMPSGVGAGARATGSIAAYESRFMSGTTKTSYDQQQIKELQKLNLAFQTLIKLTTPGATVTTGKTELMAG